MTFPCNIAYNMEEKKVGCVLLQQICGGDLTGGDVSRYFESDTWELSPKKLKLYRINNKDEFDAIVKLTNDAHKSK